MAYYRKSSPIPGYTGHIPGSKFHIGSGINRKSAVNNNCDIIVEDFLTKSSNHFDNFSINEKPKSQQSRAPSSLNFKINEEEIKKQYLNQENDKKIEQNFSRISSYRKDSISFNKSVNSESFNESNMSIEVLSNKYEVKNTNKSDDDSFLTLNSKNIVQNMFENNEIKRPNTVGRERKELLRKKMENMKPTGIWDKKPIPYEVKVVSVNNFSSEEKKNPFEGAEKGWWSEGQALLNLKNIKTNKLYENPSNDYPKIMSNRSVKDITSYTEDHPTFNYFKNDEE